MKRFMLCISFLIMSHANAQLPNQWIDAGDNLFISAGLKDDATNIIDFYALYNIADTNTINSIYKDGKKEVRNISFSSRVNKMSVNCGNNNLLYRGASYYENAMASGNIIYSTMSTAPIRKMELIPESYNLFLFNWFCSKNTAH